MNAAQLARFDAAPMIDGVVPERTEHATLISGRSQVMTRSELTALPIYEGTETHKPVPHIDLIRGIEMTLGEQGIYIAAEKFSVNRQGNALFGVMDLKSSPALPVTQGFSAAMGLRTANDKTMSIQLGVGAKVTICDNMAFNTDMIALKKKHTAGLDLITELREAVKRFIEKFHKFSVNFDEMKNCPLTDTAAKVWIYDIFSKGEIAHKYFPAVHEAYFGTTVPYAGHVPYDTDFKNTLWALHNSFTWALRTAPIPVQLATTVHIAREFAI